MSESVHRQMVQFDKMLQNVGRWLDAAEEFAKKKSFKPDTLLQARLAPDQYPLVRQIQSACDAAKSSAARLCGREPPKHPDVEQTFPEIRARIQTVRDYLGTFRAEDFAGADTRMISLSYIVQGKGVPGDEYLRELVVPNFYFHICHTYALLRHAGVDLGKIQFIGMLPLRDLPPS